MFFEAHRLSVFTPRSLDVDVVLDLMIHDLDIVLSFVASPVREVRAVGLPILSPKVDIANVRVEFDSGCVANFTASRVSTERVRKLRFFEPRQYVSIDYARQDLLVIRLDPDAAAAHLSPEIRAALAAGKLDPALLAQLAEAGGNPNPGLSFLHPPVTPGEPLRLEIESFLNSVRARREPRVTARQGRNALALALEIEAAMAAHAHRAGLDDFFFSGALGA
jgi:predicted dehydrogenase